MRTTGCGVLLSLFAVGATGCFPIAPTRPTAIEDVSITALGEQVAVVQCIAQDYRVNYVSLRVAPAGGGKGSTTAIFLAEVPLDKAVRLDWQTPIVFADMREALPPMKMNHVSISDLPRRVDIYLKLRGPNQPVEMYFLNVDSKEITQGRFVHESSVVDGNSCSS